MTEISLTLKIGKVSKFESSNVPPNIKVLRLELDYPTNIGSINKFYEKVPSVQTLKKISIGFFDGAEDEIYNKLLNNSEKGFIINLSWEKEKVNFLIPGKGEDEKDDAKPGINFLSIDKQMEIELKPQFAGVIKIESPAEKPNKDKDNGGGNNNNGGGNGNNNDKNDPAIQAKINSLQGQINVLEEKLRNQPTSNTNQQDKQELERLKRELEDLKKQQKDKSQNKGSNQKDNFPYGLVIGGGVVIVFLLLVIIFVARSRKK